MKPIFILLVFLAASAPTTAQVQGQVLAPLDMARHFEFQTRFGQLLIAGSETFVLYWRTDAGDQTLLQDWPFYLRAGFARQEEAQDWVLITAQSEPGAACPFHTRVANVREEAVRISAPFAHCLGDPTRVEVEPGRIVLEFRQPTPLNALTRFAFDGVRVTPF